MTTGGPLTKAVKLTSDQLAINGGKYRIAHVPAIPYEEFEEQTRSVVGGKPVPVYVIDDDPDFADWPKEGGKAYPYYIVTNETAPLGELAIPVSVAGGGGWPSALRDSLVAYWALDEESDGSGAVQRNDSIGSNHLTDNNTVASAEGLVYPQAADFEADNSEFLDVVDNAAISMGDIDFWIAAWVRLESKTGNSQTIIGKGGNTTGANGVEYALQYDDSADRWRFVVNDDDSFPGVNADNLGAVSVHTWYFVVGWHDATNSQIHIAVNGGPADSSAIAITVQDSTEGMGIGAWSSGPTRRNSDGRIGPVMLGKNYVPTADDRSFLFNGGAGRRL